jgi:hypothetical protein
MNDFPRGVPSYTRYFGARHDEIMASMFVDNPVYKFEISGSDPGCFSDEECNPTMHQQTFVGSTDEGENTFSDRSPNVTDAHGYDAASGYCSGAAGLTVEESCCVTSVTAVPSHGTGGQRQRRWVSDDKTCNNDFQQESNGIC